MNKGKKLMPMKIFRLQHIPILAQKCQTTLHLTGFTQKYQISQLFIAWVGKIPWRGNGNPLRYSCLRKPMDRGAQWATILGVTKESDTTERLNSSNNNKKPKDLLALTSIQYFRHRDQEENEFIISDTTVNQVWVSTGPWQLTSLSDAIHHSGG